MGTKAPSTPTAANTALHPAPCGQPALRDGCPLRAEGLSWGVPGSTGAVRDERESPRGFRTPTGAPATPERPRRGHPSAPPAAGAGRARACAAAAPRSGRAHLPEVLGAAGGARRGPNSRGHWSRAHMCPCFPLGLWWRPGIEPRGTAGWGEPPAGPAREGARSGQSAAAPQPGPVRRCCCTWSQLNDSVKVLLRPKVLPVQIGRVNGTLLYSTLPMSWLRICFSPWFFQFIEDGCKDWHFGCLSNVRIQILNCEGGNKLSSSFYQWVNKM